MWSCMQQVNRKRRREAATQRLLPFAYAKPMSAIQQLGASETLDRLGSAPPQPN